MAYCRKRVLMFLLWVFALSKAAPVTPTPDDKFVANFDNDIDDKHYRTGIALRGIDPIYQATQLSPITPEALKPIFKVFHGKAENQTATFVGPYNQTVCDQLRQHVAAVKTSDVDHLVVYVHGFKQKWNSAVHMRMRDALFTQKQHRVMLIIVDARVGFVLTLYRPLSSYAQAAMNTRTVANQMAHVTNCLTSGATAPFTLNQTHFVGFSLGGHVAGMAGNIIHTNLTDGRKVRRITGLDPAGPWFHRETDLKYKLSQDDADFVDVIHTSWDGVWGFGTDESLGHIDFYPQGAQAYLCPPVPVFGASCEHLASHELFMESMYRHYSCVMKAWRCTSWDHYQAGVCDITGENSVQMGYFLTKEEYLRALKPSSSIGKVVKDGMNALTENIVRNLPATSSPKRTSSQNNEQLPPMTSSSDNNSFTDTIAQLWQFGSTLISYLQQSISAKQPKSVDAERRVLEMLPIVGQFFLSKDEDDQLLPSDTNNNAGTRGLDTTKKAKNNYYLHVRRIYPYCYSEVEQLRMTQPETCSESGMNPM